MPARPHERCSTSLIAVSCNDMQAQPRPPATASASALTPPANTPLTTSPKVADIPPSTTPVVVVQIPETKDSGVKDWLEFGQAFAWPLALVVLAILFQKQIAKKIENMASLKTPVAETTWNAQAGTVADLAEGIVEAEVTATPVTNEIPAVDPAPPIAEGVSEPADDGVKAVSPPRRYEAVVPDTSNTESIGAVILLWNAVEQAVRDLAVSRNVDASNFMGAYRWLQRTSIIPPTTTELIDQLRKLRNDVVHLRGTDVDSDAYRRSVLAVLESLELVRRRPPPPPPPPRSIVSR